MITSASEGRNPPRHHSSPPHTDLPVCFAGSLLGPGQPSPGRISPHASCHRNSLGFRNMNRIPIGYGSRPRLRGRLTLGRRPLPRKPYVFGGRESHPSFRLLIPAFSLPSPPGALTDPPSPVHGMLPYHPHLAARIRGFGMPLSPVTLSAHGHSTSELLRTL